MEDLKIYVVLNVDKFKDLCEKKLGKAITPEHFIDMENFRNEKVHLVPHNIPHGILKYYANNKLSNYDIFVEIQNEWQLMNITEITDKDIEELVEDEVVVDLKSFEEWKDIFAFEVTDIIEFFKESSEKITDKELISLISTWNRCIGNFEIFIIEDEDEYSILYKDGKINALRKLPYSTLDKEDVLNFLKNDLIENCKCKINNETNLINIENSTYLVKDFFGRLRGISLRQSTTGKYIARGIIKTNNRDEFHNWRMINTVGETETDAVQKLKEKLLDNLHSPNITFKMYQHLLEKEDLDI